MFISIISPACQHVNMYERHNDGSSHNTVRYQYPKASYFRISERIFQPFMLKSIYFTARMLNFVKI